MRIGMMLDMYKPYISGVTNYVALNKRALEAQGHSVYVFTFGSQDRQDDEPNVIRSPGLPLNLKNTGLHVNLRYSGSAQSAVRSMDVVHVQHPFLSGQLALRYAKSSGVPVVFTNHTRYDLYARHYLPPFIPRAVSQAFLQAYMPGFCRRCDLVIAPSPGLAAVLREQGIASEVEVIPNGVDLSLFERVAPAVTRATLGLPESEVVLMYLGRLGPEKNLAFLLRAFAAAAAACSGVVLALVGGGPEADRLREQARASGLASRVFFTGEVPYAEVPAYLRLADVFVTASQTEAHPFSLIEAMAAGLPALGIISPGVGDTIVDGENGLLSSPDPEDYTARLVRLATDAHLRRWMSAKALEHVRQYDIQRTAGLLVHEYERLLRRAPRPLPGRAGLGQRLRRWLS